MHRSSMSNATVADTALLDGYMERANFCIDSTQNKKTGWIGDIGYLDCIGHQAGYTLSTMLKDCFGVPILDPSLKEKSSNFHLILYCQQGGGFGDVLFCLKTFDLLKKHFNNIYLMMYDEGLLEVIKKISPKHYQPNVTTFTIENIIKKQTEDKNFAQQPKLVICTALPSTCADKSLALFGNLLNWNSIFIDEYNGWRINRFHFHKMEVEKCKAYKKYKKRAHIDERDQYFRRNYSAGFGCQSSFSDIRVSLPTLGIHMDPSHVKINKKYQNKFLAECIPLISNSGHNGNSSCNSDSSGYYFAYNSDGPVQYLDLFIQTIALIDPPSATNPVHLIVVGEFTNRVKIEKFLLKNFGIVGLRHFNIHVIPKISHDDMIHVMLNSKPLIMVSGDQSFAEAISMYKVGKPKIIFYQKQSWKRNLIKEFQSISNYVGQNDNHNNGKYLKTFQNLAYDVQKINCGIKRKHFKIHGNLDNFDENNDYEINSQSAVSIARLLLHHQQEIIESSVKVYKYIDRYFNIENSLVQIVQNWFLSICKFIQQQFNGQSHYHCYNQMKNFDAINFDYLNVLSDNREFSADQEYRQKLVATEDKIKVGLSSCDNVIFRRSLKRKFNDESHQSDQSCKSYKFVTTKKL